MDLKDLKQKEGAIEYFSVADYYIDREEGLGIARPRNEKSFYNIEDAISDLLDRKERITPFLKSTTNLVESNIYKNAIILDEKTKEMYEEGYDKDVLSFEKKVREKYYRENFKREEITDVLEEIHNIGNIELLQKYNDTLITNVNNFTEELRESDLNKKREYEIFKKEYKQLTDTQKEYLKTKDEFGILKKAFDKEKIEFESKEKPLDWNEQDQKKLEDLITFLKENPEIKKGSAEYLNVKEKALYSSDEKEEYITKIMREIISVEDAEIYYNYKHLCDYINEEERHYLEGIREEQDNFKKTPEFDDKIKEISDSLGFGKYINFEEKLREELINRDNVNRFSIPVTLNNKRTGDVAIFNINMIYGMIGNVITYRPSILDYDLTLKKSNGEEKTLKFSYDNGELPNAKEAIAIIEKQMRVINKEEIYAYLIDDYGISTDISDRIKNITKEDLNKKRVLAMTVDEYKQHFMLDISNEASMEGRLVTNAFYVICKGSSISEIEAPNAEEIRCDNCHNLEKITAENCIQVWAMDSNIKEKNIEINYKGVIEGPELQKQLKL
jgi:hypothetical protein